MKIYFTYKSLGIALLLSLLVFVLPHHSAHAAWWDLPTANDLLALFFTTVFELMAGIILVLSSALNFAVSVRAGGDIPVVATTWKILRDFSNMIFIVLLIYMAFATIFDQGKYRFKEMIGRFIVVAVLINFSMVFGNLIIDATQVLTNIFLGSIGNIGDRLGQYLSPGALLPRTSAISAASVSGGALVSLLFALILSGILLFSMLVALAFAFIRVPFIWALLIVSPIAWMAFILPGTKKWWTMWWNQFFGWNLFLPVYLFFIYLGLVFLSKRDEIISSVIQVGTTTNPANTPIVNTLTNGLTFNLFFFYIFTAVVMVGGTWAAVSTTKMMGGGFDKGVGWAKNFVKRTPWLGSRVGSLDANQFAAQQKFAQIQKEGLPGRFNALYGGKEGLDRSRSEVAARWPYRIQKQFTGDAKKRFDELAEQYDLGKMDIEQLKTGVASSDASTAQGFAYRKLAMSKGVLNDAEFVNALAGSEKNPFAVQDLIKTARDAKFGGIGDLKAVVFNPKLAGQNFTPAKREILSHMAGDAKQAAKFSKPEDITRAVSILGGASSPESKKFLDDLSKVRPDLVFKYRADNGLFKQPSEQDVAAGGKKSTMQTLYDTLRKSLNTEPKNIAAMPDDLWKSPQFQQVLKEKLYDQNISKKNRNNLRSNLEKILSEQGADDKIVVLNSVAPRKDFIDLNKNNPAPPASPGVGGTPPASPPPAAPPNPSSGTGGTISYETQNINQKNVINLRTADLQDTE